MKSISIVMATYNGAKYIEQQLDSILPFMKEVDELIISDDGSSDETVKIIKDYQKKYNNILLVKGPRQGVVRNFESLLERASRNIIMFADQDDIWMPDKLSKIRTAFESDPNLNLVLHDMLITSNEQIDNNEKGTSSFAIRQRKHGVLYNLVYNGYYGCCMSFTRAFRDEIVPFSRKTNMYDQWIGLIAEHDKKSLFIDTPLIMHRVHGRNMSQKQSIWGSLTSKFKLYLAYRDFLIKRNS